MSGEPTPLRVRAPNDCPVREEPSASDYVLYWMTAYRRPHWNHSLDRALDHAKRLKKPLIVLEALRVGYRWASDRLHRFVLDGMSDNREVFAGGPVAYYPYVEPKKGAGSGLLEALAQRAAVVVTDDFPCFFLPRMIAAAGEKLEALGVRLEVVDGNGLYPMRDTDRVFARAFDFRRHLHKRLPEFLEGGDRPRPRPLARLSIPGAELPASTLKRWPAASDDLLSGASSLAGLDIDHDVEPVLERGGFQAARERMNAFLETGLPRYGEERNHPDDDVASGLSPFLHFGHISPHEILGRLAEREDWTPDDVSLKANGARNGFWNMSASAEAFLDELITWREVGYNMCSHRDDYDRYASLPEWAQSTLAEHETDERKHIYSLEELEHARTEDELWNAAERQLVTEGRIHNYLRMLWGKRVLEWTKRPEVALEYLIELNNKYALDGRNPNSYSGIFWVFGRYDRAWGPERPVFGKVRYMSSANTRRKLRLSDYLDRFGDSPRLAPTAEPRPRA